MSIRNDSDTLPVDLGGKTVSGRLLQLAEACRDRDVTLGELATFGDESEDVYFLLLLIFSLPFCQPIPSWGLSTPMGVLLGAIGWAMLWNKPFRMPAKIAGVKIPSKFFPMLIKGAGKLVGWMEKRLRRRKVALARSVVCRRIHGGVIVFWSVMLALPLPIPFSNLFAALPLPILAAALLEDDGVMVIRSYVASVVCLAYWLALGFFGVEIMHWLEPVGAWFRSLFA